MDEVRHKNSGDWDLKPKTKHCTAVNKKLRRVDNQQTHIKGLKKGSLGWGDSNEVLVDTGNVLHAQQKHLDDSL